MSETVKGPLSGFFSPFPQNRNINPTFSLFGEFNFFSTHGQKKKEKRKEKNVKKGR